MGVKWLLRWQPPSGGPPSASDEGLLARALDTLNALPVPEKRGWEVTCTLMRQAPAASAAVAASRVTAGAMGGVLKDMWMVQASESPETCCLVNRPEFQVLDADTAMVAIMERKLEYRTRNWVRFEGKRYTLGDFHLVLATTTSGMPAGANNLATQHLVGHVVEVEYRPVSHPDVAAPMMADVVDMLREAAAASAGAAPGRDAGSLELVPSLYEKFPGLPAAFGRQHSAVAYSRLSVVLLNSR